jgi:uncharacterized damage-inducible protein DinB
VESLFTDFSARKLRQLSGRIRECLDRLSDEQVWARGSDAENAAGNLLLHLSGNVRQWILSGIGGKPDVRVRDREFSARGGIGKDELWERLEATVEDAAAVIAALDATRLTARIRVQNYETSVLEAVYHVVEHFAQHTGQIVLLTKAATGQDLGFYKHLAPQREHGEKTP